jgi:hypothetical protein
MPTAIKTSARCSQGWERFEEKTGVSAIAASWGRDRSTATLSIRRVEE